MCQEVPTASYDCEMDRNRKSLANCVAVFGVSFGLVMLGSAGLNLWLAATAMGDTMEEMSAAGPVPGIKFFLSILAGIAGIALMLSALILSEMLKKGAFSEGHS